MASAEVNDAAARQGGGNDGKPADSLDLTVFLSSLQKEINDLHKTIKASRDGRVEKAFQRLPRNMRRRTASHNAKRVPKRLRKQAQRDQAADNTPSVATGLAKRKKARPASAWVYENTKKRIKIQQEKKLAAQGYGEADAEIDGEVGDSGNDEAADGDPVPQPDSAGLSIGPRRPLPIKDLRLPTHRWQAKRAQMANPGGLWNSVIVTTPANKTYRMSLRSAGLRPGMCVSWDTSYMATIYLQGPSTQLDVALTSVVEPHLLTSGLRTGSCCVDVKLPQSFGYQQQHLHQEAGCREIGELGGPGNCGIMTLLYNPTNETITDDTDREAFLRVHPTIFSHIWTTLNKEVAQRQLKITIRDFRLEVGSIDVTGSCAAETLASTLYPYQTKKSPIEPHGKDLLQLRDIDTTGLAPASSLMLAFNIQDPRLDEPAEPEKDQQSSSSSIGSILARWPPNKEARSPSGLFDNMFRHRATRQLPQSTLDKRRGKLAVGEKLLLTAESHPIPVILAGAGSSIPAAADPNSRNFASPTWTLLAPRTCIDMIWYRLHLQRLRNGQRPLYAGLDEERHMSLERGRPWFPADFPGTPTGWDWELQSRRRLEKEWNDKPSPKRTQWNAIDLGGGKKGELGSGFACDWEFLYGTASVPTTLAGSSPEEEQADVQAQDSENAMDISDEDEAQAVELEEEVQFEALKPQKRPDLVRQMQHATWAEVRAAVYCTRLHRQSQWRTPYQLMTISVQLLWGGVPDPLARIYRLPAASSGTDDNVKDQLHSGSSLRQLWLAQAAGKAKTRELELQHLPPPPPRRMPRDADMVMRKKLLAQSLLETPLPYPRPTSCGADSDASVLPMPDAADLIGFVTSGAHRFQNGKGFGIGHVSAQKLVEAIVRADGEAEAVKGDVRDDEEGSGGGGRTGRVPINREARFCIVRNVGQRVGHLARWTPISH